MSRVFDKIPEWITERSSGKLNSVVSEEKLTRIKLALHIGDERQVELVIMELADDSFFIPAIFKPDDIRKKFGLSDLALSIESLEERIIKVKTYAVSAYKSNNNLYPYLIVTDFEYIKGRSRINDDLQHAYTVKQVENWIDHVQQSIHNLHNPVSKMFPCSALMAQYPNLATLECHLEAILPRMYKLKPRIPMDMTRERARSDDMRNRAERGEIDHTSIETESSNSNHNENMASDAVYDHANHEQLAATSSMIDCHPSEMQHSPAPPVDHLALQVHLLSTFDDIEDIPDELCIDSGPEPKEEAQANTPSPIANSPHSVASSPSMNVSPSMNASSAMNVTTSSSPGHMPFSSYSPGPSNTNGQVSLHEPRVPDGPMLIGRLYDFNRVPGNYDSFKRRRLCSDYRLEYLK